VIIGQCFQAKKRRVTGDWLLDTIMSSTVAPNLGALCRGTYALSSLTVKHMDTQQNFSELGCIAHVNVHGSVHANVYGAGRRIGQVVDK
jgi:hypothetical protein